MESHIENAISAVDRCDKIDPSVFQKCAGVALIAVTDIGLVLTGSGGRGVIVKQNQEDGSWSAPMFCEMTSFQIGVIGCKHKQVVIALNEAALLQMTEGTRKMQVGMDAGFSIGKCGGLQAGSVGGSIGDKGLSSLLCCCFSDMPIVGAAPSTSSIHGADSINQEVCGSSAAPDIFAQSAPKAAAEMMEKVNKLGAV